MFNYSSASEIKRLLGSHNIAALKRFGQNFMLSEASRRRFVGLLFELVGEADVGAGARGGAVSSPGNSVSEADVGAGAEVWEIGPGIGSLTSLVLERGFAMRCFEIDKGFVRCLQAIFAREIATGQLNLVEGNALHTIFAQDISTNKPRAILGNLPYNIASVILSKLITGGFFRIPMVFTFQREVVERICASPGTANYGGLSVLCQSAMQTRNCGIIKPNAFYPVPRIHSASIQLIPMLSPSLQTQDLIRLEKLLAILFHSRRKTIANNIKQAYRSKRGNNAQGGRAQNGNSPEAYKARRATDPRSAPAHLHAADPRTPPEAQLSQPALLQALRAVGIDPSLRAEQVSVPQYRQILAYLSENQNENESL